MSRQRAQRRAVREAEVAAAREARERALARRARRQAVARRMLPDQLARPGRAAPRRLFRRGRVGQAYLRRSAGQRAVIVGVAAVLVLLVWTSFDGLATRIALTLALVIATPALVVLAFGRRHDRR
jgi:hypothetical protein